MGETFASRVAELARDESLRALVLTGAGRCVFSEFLPTRLFGVSS